MVILFLERLNMLDDIEHIAKVCHEANRAFCESMGDFSQVHWNQIPKWQHDSIVEGVAFIMGNPGAGPEASHEAGCNTSLIMVGNTVLLKTIYQKHIHV